MTDDSLVIERPEALKAYLVHLAMEAVAPTADRSSALEDALARLVVAAREHLATSRGDGGEAGRALLGSLLVARDVLLTVPPATEAALRERMAQAAQTITNEVEWLRERPAQ